MDDQRDEKECVNKKISMIETQKGAASEAAAGKSRGEGGEGAMMQHSEGRRRW